MSETQTLKEQIEWIGLHDPMVHKYLQLQQLNNSSWVETLEQMVIHLVQDRATLRGDLLVYSLRYGALTPKWQQPCTEQSPPR